MIFFFSFEGAFAYTSWTSLEKECRKLDRDARNICLQEVKTAQKEAKNTVREARLGQTYDERYRECRSVSNTSDRQKCFQRLHRDMLKKARVETRER